MLINVAEPERHTVFDYDITLDSGFLLSVTVDPTQGDTIDIGRDVTAIHLSAKPSKLNPKDTLPEEDISVFTPHVLVMTKKARLVAMVTPEAQASWLDAFKETASSTIQ